jgi:hypothetical protein
MGLFAKISNPDVEACFNLAAGLFGSPITKQVPPAAITLWNILLRVKFKCGF